MFVAPFVKGLPNMTLLLRDEQPRGHGKVVTRADRVNFAESPECYDYYKMCAPLTAAGRCDGKAGPGPKVATPEWMKVNCRFSCKQCGGDNNDEL